MWKKPANFHSRLGFYFLSVHLVSMLLLLAGMAVGVDQVCRILVQERLERVLSCLQPAQLMALPANAAPHLSNPAFASLEALQEKTNQIKESIPLFNKAPETEPTVALMAPPPAAAVPSSQPRQSVLSKIGSYFCNITEVRIIAELFGIKLGAPSITLGVTPTAKPAGQQKSAALPVSTSAPTPAPSPDLPASSPHLPKPIPRLAATDRTVTLPAKHEEQLGRITGLEMLWLHSGSGSAPFFWSRRPNARPRLARALAERQSRNRSEHITLQTERSFRHMWCYQYFRVYQDEQDRVWQVFLEFNMLPAITQFMVPGIFLVLVVTVLLTGIIWSITVVQERKTENAISGLEDSLKDVFLGQYDILFEAKEFSFTQRLANVMNQMMFYFNQNVKKREVVHQQDVLTKLYTRRYLMDALEREISRAVRYHSPLSFIMIDVDHFKRFNDKHGHLLGDRVLKKTAETIMKNIRETDCAARYGGEEIAVLLYETPLKEAVHLAQKLRQLVEKTKYVHKDEILKVTISLGVTAFINAQEDGATLLIKRADEALYEAKDNGRNQVCQRGVI